jgi:peptidoglycan-associated lipoprotein
MYRRQNKGENGMRREGWLAIALVLVLPVMLFTASCSKQAAQTKSESTNGAEIQKAEAQKAEARKAQDRPAEEARPDRQLEADRLQAETAAREAALAAFVGENIHFDFDSFLLSDRARQILVAKAEYLRTNPDMTVTVEGHCDDRGTNEYNVALGERRAQSVKTFLVNLGVDTNQLNTVSYGEERPIATGHDEASRAENRRAQFVIDGSPGNRISSKN